MKDDLAAKKDRELLKLAAMAADMKWIDDCPTGLTIQKQEGNGLYNFHWNPLADDGAALRLAVKLGMIISADTIKFKSTTAVIKGKGTEIFHEDHRDDPYAATRRAIVRAAASLVEIGIAQ